ncbi:putative uncharacterized protein DDB_G0282133 [Penaeus chinensis]|uniref:putative uncharacterized protein DDB_G0282133 n=1 Tax=Penaeus chinensis TaxID=139456 RepID=UPI001FB65DD1|nr:putative uncharacterized protein DDB_G0282133 [Penaeus chinensis]
MNLRIRKTEISGHKILNDFHPVIIQSKQTTDSSSLNPGNSDQQNLGKALFGLTNLQNRSFEQQKLGNSETGNLKGHNSDTQNLENLDFIHPLNTQDIPESPDIQSHFNSNDLSNPNIQSNRESQNMQNNFDSKNMQHDTDSQNTQSNYDSKNIRSDSDSQTIQSKLAIQNIQNNLGPQNIQGNLDLQTNFEAQTHGKSSSEFHNHKQQNLKHSDTIHLEKDHFNSENQENTGSQLFIPGFFHSQNSNNHFDSHNIQASQNIPANSDDQIKQDSLNVRFASQNLGKSISESKNFPNRSLEPQNMKNAGNLQNNNFQSQNLENSNFQSQNLENPFPSQNLENSNFESQYVENNNFQSQNLENHVQSQNQNNNFQSQNLEKVESEFTYLLSGRLQPPTRDFNYFESNGGQNYSDTQIFQNSFNPEYTLDSQRGHINTDSQNRGKLLSQHSEWRNSHGISAEQQNLEKTSSGDLEKSQNLEVLQSEQEQPQMFFVGPPFKEYNYSESQNKDFKNESKIQFQTNLLSQNSGNVEFSSQPEHFTTQNFQRNPSVSHNQENGVVETHNQARNDFLNVDSEVQNGHSGRMPSTSLLNGNQKPQIMAAVGIKNSQIQRFENLGRPRNSPSNQARVQDEENHVPEPRAQEIISAPETQEAQEGGNSKTSQLQTQSVHMTQQNNNVQIQVTENHDNEAHILHENSSGLRSLKTVHIQSPTQFFNSFEPLRLQDGDNWRSNRDNLLPQIQTADLQVKSENAESVDLISQSGSQSKTLQNSTNSEGRPSIQLNGHVLPHTTHHDLLSHASQPEGSVGNSQVIKNDQLASEGSQRDQLRLQSQNSQIDDQLHPPVIMINYSNITNIGQLQPQSQNEQLQAQIDQDITFPLPDQQRHQTRAQSRESRKINRKRTSNHNTNKHTRTPNPNPSHHKPIPNHGASKARIRDVVFAQTTPPKLRISR